MGLVGAGLGKVVLVLRIDSAQVKKKDHARLALQIYRFGQLPIQ